MKWTVTDEEGIYEIIRNIRRLKRHKMNPGNCFQLKLSATLCSSSTTIANRKHKKKTFVMNRRHVIVERMVSSLNELSRFMMTNHESVIMILKLKGHRWSRHSSSSSVRKFKTLSFAGEGRTDCTLRCGRRFSTYWIYAIKGL